MTSASPVTSTVAGGAPKRVSKISFDGASLRWNFSWTFVGNVINSACQWGTLVLLAKLGNPEMVGQYGLALAVAAPVLALSSLQLRAVLTTDVHEKIHFGEYLGFRLLTTVLSLLVIAGISFHYRWQSMVVILIIGIAQALETVSDMYWARMQLYDHMDRIAKSMIARGVLGLAAMTAGVYLTRSVVWGAVGLMLARAVVVVGYDIRQRTHLTPNRVVGARVPEIPFEWEAGVLAPRLTWTIQGELLRTSITLGVIAMLVSLLPNIPRYFIVGSLGERSLGIFTATAFLVSTGNLFITAMGTAAFVRLAKHYAAGDVPGFKRLLWQLLGIVALLGLAGVGVAVLLGHLLLTLLYRPEYAEHTDLLIAMMGAGVFSYIGTMLGTAVTSARFFKAQIPVLATAVGAAALASLLLIRSHGLLGAGFAVMITSAVLCAGQATVMWFAIRKMRQPAVVAA
jgi:O-antigen/teichoic acid export membrane protein